MLEGVDWQGWFKTISGAGIGTIIVQPLVALLNDRRTRKRQASYMALRLAIVLESYASACSDLIEQNSSAQHLPGEEYPGWDLILPKLPEFPEEADGWRALELNLAERALGLRNLRHFAQAFIEAILEYQDADDAMVETKLRAAEIGLEAWNTAVGLRSQYRMRPPNLVYDFVETLKSTVNKKKQNSN